MDKEINTSESSEHDEPALAEQASPETPEPLAGTSKQSPAQQGTSQRIILAGNIDQPVRQWLRFAHLSVLVAVFIHASLFLEEK